MSHATVLKVAVFVAIIGVLGCYIETSVGGSETLSNAKGVEFLIQQQFSLKVANLTITVDCPSGLSGAPGHLMMCSGRTSDGYALEIEVRENGDGGFNWLIVRSTPIGDRTS